LLTDDGIGILKEISELELYLTPNMGVYKCLISSGFVHFLFKSRLIPYMIALEELLEFAMVGDEPFHMGSEAAEGRHLLNRSINDLL
jgi:hypothetical protein